MLIQHMDVGARGSLRLVRDNDDRRALIGAVHGELKGLLLSWVIMDTHFQACIEGERDHVLRWTESAMTRYLKAFARRHGDGEMTLRGPVVAIEKTSVLELERSIKYDHANPVGSRYPRARDHAWSSAREYLGLSLRPFAKVRRVVQLIGDPGVHDIASAAMGPPFDFADPAPREIPASTPDALLAAAAMAYGNLDARRLPSDERADELDAPRALFLELGTREGYRRVLLAQVLRRCDRQIRRIAAAVPMTDREISIARTLIQEGYVDVRKPGHLTGVSR